MIHPPLIKSTLIVAGLTLIAAGIAYASIPDTSGVISACYKKSSPNQGTLRVIDPTVGQTCSSAESPLSWNQRGPSDAYITSDSGPPITYQTPIISRTLPAGNYTLIAKSGIYNLGNADLVDCQLKSGNATLDEDIIRIDGTNTNTDDEWFELIGAVSLTGPTTISVVCSGQNTGTLSSDNPVLLATQVANLHS
jgi:hypothetical protein